VLEATGGAPALSFAVERFQDLLRDDHEAWCSLAAAVPDRRLIDLIEPHLRRQQPMIDGCFCLLCVLAKYEHADASESAGNAASRVGQPSPPATFASRTAA
jgi:hypothetical protein